jgi:pyridinium-3,5-biscarboxylic acid mononucleotide synthase
MARPPVVRPGAARSTALDMDHGQCQDDALDTVAGRVMGRVSWRDDLDSERLRELLEDVRAGQIGMDDAVEQISRPHFVDTMHARVDTHRALRQGIPEVVYGAGKSPEQIVEVAHTLRQSGQDVLVTRVEADKAAAVLRQLPEAEYDSLARLVWIGPSEVAIRGKGTVLVVSAGTADLPVAAEAQRVAQRFGNKVEMLQDVGVAGVHRLLAASELLRSAQVLIVVAGMEGALPSVVGGLVDKPVIAVPTSVGYGAAFGGVAALLGMLTSCASNVTVVNIDNGFGAAHVATLINRL